MESSRIGVEAGKSVGMKFGIQAGRIAGRASAQQEHARTLAQIQQRNRQMLAGANKMHRTRAMQARDQSQLDQDQLRAQARQEIDRQKGMSKRDTAAKLSAQERSHLAQAQSALGAKDQMYQQRIRQGINWMNHKHNQAARRDQKRIYAEGRRHIQDAMGRGEAVRMKQEQEYERALDQQKSDLVRHGRQKIQEAIGYGKAQHLKLEQEKDRDVKRFRMVAEGHKAEHERAVTREKMGLAKQRSLHDKIKTGEQALHLQHTKGASLKTELDKQRRDAANASRLSGAKERSLGDKIGEQQKRLGELWGEGTDLAKRANAKVAKLTSDIDQNVGTIRSLRDALAKAQADLAAARAAARKSKDASMMKEVDRLADQLKDAKFNIKQKAAQQPQRAAAPAPRAAAPIVVQGGSGGGGASSSAGGSSASSGGSGSGAAGRAPDLRPILEAVKKIAESVQGKKGAAKAGGTGTKGITQARRAYTDKRKMKMAELRSLKSKRIREFNTKTKKMPKAERDKARRAFKAKVEAQFKEAQKQFPTARGMKTVGALRELTRKISAMKTAK
jgi:hypothetical protein